MSEKQGQMLARRRIGIWLLRITLWCVVLLALMVIGLNYTANRHAFRGDEKEMPQAWRKLEDEVKSETARLDISQKKVPIPSGLLLRTDAQTTSVWIGAGELPRQLDDASSLTLGWQAISRTIPEYGSTSWRPGKSLNAKMLRWLDGHDDLIERILAFEESGQLPVLIKRPYSWWPPEWNWMRTGHQVIYAEMQRRQGLGNSLGARRIAEALFQFIDTIQRQKNIKGVGIYEFNQDWVSWNDQLAWMVESDLLSPARQAYLCQTLAMQHRDFLHFTENQIKNIGSYGLYGRQHLIKMLNSPWNSEYFLKKYPLMRSRYAEMIDTTIYRFKLVRYDLMTLDDLAAMHLAQQVKSQAEAMLNHFNDYVLTKMDYARLSYPEMVAKMPPQLSWPFPRTIQRESFFDDQFPLLYDKIQSCVNETRLNLMRAALEYQRGGRPLAGDAGLDLRHDPENPWRDPFTERPFRLVEEASATLIYSLGPDMQDQHGKVECNIDRFLYPEDKLALPPGDLTLRIAH